MDEQNARADRVGGVRATQEDVLEERPAEPSALVRSVDG
jgi:hypothetical protein